MTCSRGLKVPGGGAVALAAMMTGACAPGLQLATDERALVDPKSRAVNVAGGSPLALRNFGDLVTYGAALSETYVTAADRIAAGQDAAALGIIAAAATAVGGLAFNAPAAVTGGAGLAGGVIAAGTQYVNGPSAIKALLAASTQVACVVRAGQSSLPLDSFYTEHREFERQRMAIVQGGYVTARIELRRALIRELPDFAGTFSALQAASKPGDAAPAAAPAVAQGLAKDARAAAEAEAAIRAALKAANDKMLKDVAICFVPAPLVAPATSG
ncbi:MAG: hypothetical protein ACE37J_02705 [Pikeienuella sp.]|uniref:hypothetical protein n=1 Tax=Pikeienuella sp. TaxID=2831957 RepID=UPI00391CB4C7